jgi:hypothetical protein
MLALRRRGARGVTNSITHWHKEWWKLLALEVKRFAHLAKGST